MNRPTLTLETLAVASPGWRTEVAALSRGLGAPEDPLLFPDHFLQSTFPKIGGRAVLVRREGRPAAAAFLFPRALRGERREYTARSHFFAAGVDLQAADILSELIEMTSDGDLVGYDPRLRQPYCASRQAAVDGIEIGRPGEGEAGAARELQRRIWGSANEDLYPADLHSSTFRAATSLVARAGAEVAGFLFGFYKFGGPSPPDLHPGIAGALRVESQVAGVDPRFQGRGVGFRLKKAQAEQASREGIEVINWTVDPLQSRNAALNFGKLRAVACRFFPHHYALRNEKNRTPASRLEITWLIATTRVREALAGGGAQRRVLDLARKADITVLNDSVRKLSPAAVSDRIAIEIPADWDTLQESDLDTALKWRAATDELFAAWLGPEEDRFMITDAGVLDDRRYLVAERVGIAARDEQWRHSAVEGKPGAVDFTAAGHEDTEEPEP